MPKRKRTDKKPKASKQEAQPEEAEDGAKSSVAHVDDTNPPASDPTEDANIQHFTILFGDKKPIPCVRHQLVDHDSTTSPSLIFTHGAGGGITTPAVRDFARGFGEADAVVTWQGNMNLTSRVRGFKTVFEAFRVEGGRQVALGGRSMGARAAVLTALEMIEEGGVEAAPEALVLVSWPLTAGKEGKREPERREQILKDLPEGVDVLFVLGERDEMCDMEMFEGLRGEMKARSWVVVVNGADHGMGLRAKDGVEKMRMRTGGVAAEWLRERDGEKRKGTLEWDGEREEIVWSGWRVE